jgi:hypothetical protein
MRSSPSVLPPYRRVAETLQYDRFKLTKNRITGFLDVYPLGIYRPPVSVEAEMLKHGLVLTLVYTCQCFGSGSGSVLDPYSIGPLDPDP